MQKQQLFSIKAGDNMAGGRPKKEINYELAGKLAAIQCTQEEIADILDISRQTLLKDEQFLYIFRTKNLLSLV